MSLDFIQQFGKATYPCYGITQDGEFWMNDAATSSEAGKTPLCLPEEKAVRAMLQAALRAEAENPHSGMFNLPLLCGALYPAQLNVLPVAGGLFAFLPIQQDLPMAAFSTQLREPLTNIFALLPLLAQKLEDSDLKYLESIQRNSYTMLRLASNIEAAARLERKGFELRRLDLCEVVRSVCFCASTVSKGIGVDITARLPEEELPVLADEQLLWEMILNVLRNAMQYTRDGNSVNVRLKRVGRRALLTVEDKGHGIKPESLERIFEPYFTADPYGESGSLPGLGLGLAVVRETARVFGGAVTAESRYGEGTSLTIALPLADDGDPILKSDPAGYLLNRYSPVYIQLVGFCNLPGV